MADKPKATPTVVTSFAKNPLVTPFVRPNDCSNIYRSGFLSVLDVAPTCMPEAFNSDPTFYFSPVYKDDVTLSCVKTASLQSVWSTLFCTWIAPEETSLPIVLSEDGVTSTVMSGFTSPGGLNAFGVRMVYQSSDVESRTGTDLGALQGATIAIGVVVPVVALAIIGALIFYWRSRKRQRAVDVPPAGGSTQYGQTPYGEMQQKNVAQAELPAATPVSNSPPLHIKENRRNCLRKRPEEMTRGDMHRLEN
ncbi:unnamed protein product [Parascedosporium putredinis]|uniref:Mid2 domain-containing protein n=1 Tax=Parascedosporium putredinis TaxID=1442378 RepID=A0A9P1M959_9PEZI|nr:unnamed protein product [Parascedosporium putredinis]CAI7990192.1 unnamed protein product [Parascedosporium putredinis]